MFAPVVAPLLSAVLISLALINLSPRINPSLHLFLREHLKELHNDLPVEYLRQCSFTRLNAIFSVWVLLAGMVVLVFEGLHRLVFLIPLSFVLIYGIYLTILAGVWMANLPVYMFLFVCLMIVLFYDCALFDEL